MVGSILVKPYGQSVFLVVLIDLGYLLRYFGCVAQLVVLNVHVYCLLEQFHAFYLK